MFNLRFFDYRFSGYLLSLLTLLVILHEWTNMALIDPAIDVVTVILLLCLATNIRRGGMIFLAVGLGLAGASVAFLDDPAALIDDGFQRSAFIAAFFTALATLRHAAENSPGIQAAGKYLADQPPGRRYLALTIGGQLYALVLNYGSIALLGSLASSAAKTEPNAEIRGHRLRRMLLAIQRGFIATLPWSPLTFAVAISLSLVPDAKWSEIVLPCFVSGLILMGTGWALDTIFKPKLSRPAPPRSKPEGGLRSLAPLITLLILLISLIMGLHAITGVRAVAIVLILVPVISLGWIALQATGGHRSEHMREHTLGYLKEDLPAYRNELVLLMMAGFIGTLGAYLLQPLMSASGFDFSVLPGWLILVSLVWVIPIAGQLGMNPILSVSLLLPLLPDPGTAGYNANQLIVATTSGWALSGASSPFTATTMLIGSFGGKSALHVGLRWNGVYSFACAGLLSIWVALVAAF